MIQVIQAVIVLSVFLVLHRVFCIEMVAKKGANIYYRHRITGHRWAVRHDYGYSAVDQHWVNTGKWTDTSKMRPPKGPSGASCRPCSPPREN